MRRRNFAVTCAALALMTSSPHRSRTVAAQAAAPPAAAADDDRRKAADYYAACMDESKIDAAGLTPVAPDLATIDALVNPDDLPVLIAHLHGIGVRALFRFGAQTDVLGDASQSIADVDQGGPDLH